MFLFFYFKIFWENGKSNLEHEVLANLISPGNIPRSLLRKDLYEILFM
jgi:hypothetical protein